MVDDEFRDELVVAFGLAVRERRLELGLRQIDVANWIGRSQTTLSHFESGQRRPDLSDAVLIARCLDVPLGTLVAPLAPLLDALD